MIVINYNLSENMGFSKIMEIYTLIIQAVSGILVAIGLFYAGRQVSLLGSSEKCVLFPYLWR